MPRILVADDNTNIQRMVSLAFQDRGIEVTAVGNGEAAVRRIPDLHPDLVLADIFMPVRNGYELCEWVKKDSKYSHIPVILLVGAFDPLDEKEARRVGADGILKKPFIPPDPLIAMVTSVLEKAAKAAPEMPKPKAIPAPPPAPAVIAPVALEVAQMVEVEAPADAPEVSADDASLAYGFGAGRRGLEDEGTAASAADHAPKAESEKESEDEFDAASTTNGWRRTAMEFEIPEEAARRPAFSQDIESGYPSEREAQPNSVKIAHPGAQVQATVEPVEEHGEAPNALSEWQFDEPEPTRIPTATVAAEETNDTSALAAVEPKHFDELAIAQESQESNQVTLLPAAADHKATEHNSTNQGNPTVALAKRELSTVDAERAEVRTGDESDSVAASELSAKIATSASATREEAQSPVHDVPFLEGASTAEPSFASRGSHWMDLMASTSDQQPPSDWFSSVIRPSAKAEAPCSEEAATAVPAPTIEGSASHHAAAESAPSVAESRATEDPSQVDASSTSVLHAEAVASEETVRVTQDDSFFADESEEEPEAAPPAFLNGAAGPEFPAAPRAEHDSRLDETPASEGRNRENEFESRIAGPVAAAVSTDSALIDETTDEPTLAKDADLVEPPAVRVTPEPLLIDESPNEHPRYGAVEQEIAPVYSFLSRLAAEPAASQPEPEPQPEPVAEQPQNASEPAISEAHSASESAPDDMPGSLLEFSSSEFDDRMPRSTPSREALAEIPFLNPPRAFHCETNRSSAENGDATDSVDVEALAQKILEKIEPQIRELLSQNFLKPLIETLVQNELEKKHN